MIATLLMTYVVNLLSSAPDSSLRGAIAVSSCERNVTKPARVTLAHNGAVAWIVPTFPGDDNSGGRRIIVQRPDGSRVELAPPSDSILARHFRMKLKTAAGPRFQDVYFHSVRLEDDGTPVATVACHFWGGYSGVETAAYRWNGAGWKVTPSYNLMPPAVPGWAVNIEVGAVETARAAAFNGVYGHQWVPDRDFINDPNYQRNEVERLEGDRVVALGPGTATAIRGSLIVGFKAGVNPFGPSCERPRLSYAIAWSGDAATRIGQGVAYDVNAGGDIVGDNEERFGEAGQPMLWRRGRALVLDRRHGSAYAIADNGTIVGQVGHDAFIADANQPHGPIRLLDNLLGNHGWHIITAYGIAARGQILANARRGSGKVRVVLLEPHS